MAWIDLARSAWTYETGATGGLGIEFVAISGGALYLNDPAGGQPVYYFGALGAGLSFGFKIPKLPKVQVRGKSVSAAGSIKQLPSGGTIWKRSHFGNRDLSRTDIQGAVVFLEGAIGLGIGVSGDAMLFGINAAALAGAIAASAAMPLVSSYAIDAALNTATGAMVFGGLNVGPQAGGGIAGLVGYMG